MKTEYVIVSTIRNKYGNEQYLRDLDSLILGKNDAWTDELERVRVMSLEEAERILKEYLTDENGFSVCEIRPMPESIKGN